MDDKDMKMAETFEVTELKEDELSPEEVAYLESKDEETSIRDSLEEEEKAQKSGGVLKEILEWTQSIAVAIVLALLINQFLFAMVQVEGSSMEPTLESGERLVITKLFYKPEAGDIVVVKSQQLGKHIIKRVIAVPGDVLDIHAETGDVILNGNVLDEPYIKEKLRSAGVTCEYPLTIPEDFVFVMGDNRNNSQDSRNLGLVSFDDVVGKASLRITPFSEFGFLD